MGEQSTSSDLINVNAMKEKHFKILQACQEKLGECRKCRGDYINLKKKLETIADKLSYNTLVPLGTAGIMYGKLIHTNEILVLLGDNWFVDRSAKQAVEIVDRRLKRCEYTIEKYEKERDLFQNWKNLTDQVAGDTLNNLTDISEPYNAEMEKLWNERHKDSVRKEKLSESKQPVDKDPGDVWEKLEQLERQEIRRQELQIASDSPDTDVGVPAKKGKEQDSSKDEEKVKSVKKKVGWSIDDKHEEEGNSVGPSQEVSNSISIQSPSDIYKYFGQTSSEKSVPKSILKSQPKSEKMESAMADEHLAPSDPPSKFMNTESAFSGVVVERLSDPSPASFAPPEPSKMPSRPVSKFKAARTKP